MLKPFKLFLKGFIMPYSRVTQTSNLNAIRAKTCEVALYGSNPTANDTATEVSGAGYARVSVSFTTPAATGSGVYISNSTALTFPVCTGDYPFPVTHFAVREVGGPMLFYGTLQELGIDTSHL